MSKEEDLPDPEEIEIEDLELWTELIILKAHEDANGAVPPSLQST